MRLVLIDVDGTLLEGGSEVRFIRHLIARRRIGLRALLRSCVFTLSHAARHGRHVWKKNKAYLAGLGSAEIEQLATAFVRERLRPALRQAVLERIAEHRGKGDRVLLLTGTPDFIAKPLAEAIGADGWIATCCAAQAGTFLGEGPTLHPFAADKLRLAQAAAAELGLTLDQCAAYADSIHDRDLLQAVGRAVAVAPDRRLLAQAERSGWEILECGPPRKRPGMRTGRFLPPKKAATRPL